MESDDLFSLEIFIENIHNITIECGIPAVAFRFLDYPTLLVYYTELDVIDKINKKLESEHILSDNVLKDLNELRSSNNGYDFHKGKSCLFRQKWSYLKHSLAEVPLYVTLVDCLRKIGGSGGVVREKPRILGVASLPLLPLVGTVEEARTGPHNDSPVTAYKVCVVKLFNLMGTQIGLLNVSVKLTCYGTSLLRHVTVEDNKDDSHINIFLKNLSLNDGEGEKLQASDERENISPIRELISPDGKIIPDEETTKNEKSSQTKRRQKRTRSKRITKHVRETMYTEEEEEEHHIELDEEHDNMFRPPPLFLNLHPSQCHTITNKSISRRGSDCNTDDITIQRSRFLTETKFQEFTDEGSCSTSSNEDNDPIIERLYPVVARSVYTLKTNSYYGNNKNNAEDPTVESHLKSNSKKINNKDIRKKEVSNHDNVSVGKLKRTMPTLCSLVAEIAKFNDILNGGDSDDERKQETNTSDHIVKEQQEKKLTSKKDGVLMESFCVRNIKNQTKKTDVKSASNHNKDIEKQSDNKKQQQVHHGSKKKIRPRREGRNGGNKTKLNYGLTRTQRLRYAITHGGMNLPNEHGKGGNGVDEESADVSQTIHNISRDGWDGESDRDCKDFGSTKGKIFDKFFTYQRWI